MSPTEYQSSPGALVSPVVITSTAPAQIPLSIKAVPTQTGDLLDISSATGTGDLFQITTVSGAVSGLKLTTTATGTDPSLNVQSTDAARGLTLNPKGNAAINITGAAVPALNVATVGSNSVVVLTDTGGNGAGLKMTGNGASTPSKTIRVFGGVLEFLNNAYSAVIFRVQENASQANSITVTGTATGTAPTIAAGGETNVALNLVSGGTQGIQINGAAALLSGAGVPAVGNGNNGDLWLRTDGGAGTTIYQKRAGAWVATAA